MATGAKRPNRDSVTTINQDGSHYTLHPADVKGKFTLSRRVFGIFLLAIYVLLPWIPINGFPAVFFDLAKHQFHFFGLTFLAEDLWIGFFLLTGLGFGLFYVTALLGRLWCGWACPYTVFLEHLYRRVERLIDGDASRRRQLDVAPWSFGKTTRRVIKHSIYIAISAALAHIFVSYFVSIPGLYQYMIQSPLNNAKAFGVMLFLTFALYGSFAWFREQFCIIMCPYGRIQSALTDDDTVIIGYDAKRGEPRGKATDPNAGDCIDCHRCVTVCPTGIDIREGLQMECIGCAACIDACDEIMVKVDRPKGLVRYDSMNGLEGKKRKFLRPRIFLYTGLMLIGVSVLAIFLSGLHTTKMEITRMPGQPFYVTETDVRNQFEIQMVSKRNIDTEIVSKAIDLPEGAVAIGLDEPVHPGPLGKVKKTFFVSIPKDQYTGGFRIKVNSAVTPGDYTLTYTVEFLGPSAYTLKKKETP